MDSNKPVIVQLENDFASLTVDSFGGAITAFCLKENEINPLSFAFSKEQMPDSNKAGANYQGHFACIGRWGEPSAGEVNAGLVNHGEPANMQWTIAESTDAVLKMYAVAAKEGLKVDRTIIMDQDNPVYAVEETITNINSLGRMVNIVQHPTLAAPFLDEHTLVDCNALNGFDQAHYKNILGNIIKWPKAKDQLNNIIDLRNPHCSYNAVYSFIVDPADDYGWITSFSPTHNLLFGYVWKRSDYPWIHLWQHYIKNKIQYRGIEFGTAGIHQPFNQILDTATTVFGERTYAFIDAGETITKNYLSFIQPVRPGFKGVKNVHIANEQLVIIAMASEDDIHIKITKSIK
jgi:hypothetical protein